MNKKCEVCEKELDVDDLFKFHGLKICSACYCKEKKAIQEDFE